MTIDRIEFGAQAPAWEWDVSGSALRDCAQAIEDIGFDWLFVTDHVVFGYDREDRKVPGYNGGIVQHEALTMLAFLSACTSRAALCTAVLVLPQRDPVLVAKQAAEIDVLSGGRLRLGVGVGWSQLEFEALGARFTNRGARAEEAVALMRACWMQEPVSFAGRYTTLDGMSMLPKPVRAGGPPVLFGGSSPAAEDRAARIGDGWMGMGFVRPEQAAETIARLRGHLRAHGRDERSFAIQWTTALRDPERTAARLGAYAHAGARWLGVTMPGDGSAASVDDYVNRLSDFWTQTRPAVLAAVGEGIA